VVSGAENLRPMTLDVLKKAVPVGTVVGLQLLLLLKSFETGTASQVRARRAGRERRHRNPCGRRQQRGDPALQPRVRRHCDPLKCNQR
jgi:hypothetical protein